MNLNLILAGVGGQGTVLASRIIARAALDAGLSVRSSETIESTACSPSPATAPCATSSSPSAASP